jgi:hypothetical protein
MTPTSAIVHDDHATHDGVNARALRFRTVDCTDGAALVELGCRDT